MAPQALCLSPNDTCLQCKESKRERKGNFLSPGDKVQAPIGPRGGLRHHLLRRLQEPSSPPPPAPSLTLTRGAHRPAPAAPGPAHSSARRRPYFDGPGCWQLQGKVLVRGKGAVHSLLAFRKVAGFSNMALSQGIKICYLTFN